MRAPWKAEATLALALYSIETWEGQTHEGTLWGAQQLATHQLIILDGHHVGDEKCLAV